MPGHTNMLNVITSGRLTITWEGLGETTVKCRRATLGRYATCAYRRLVNDPRQKPNGVRLINYDPAAGTATFCAAV